VMLDGYLESIGKHVGKNPDLAALGCNAWNLREHADILANSNAGRSALSIPIELVTLLR